MLAGLVLAGLLVAAHATGAGQLRSCGPTLSQKRCCAQENKLSGAYCNFLLLMQMQPQPAPEQRQRGPPTDPLPPCAALFISGLPVAVPGAGWKRPLEKAFGRFSARGKPRIRVARNKFNNAVGYGWIENVLLEQACQAVAALNGTLKLDGQPIAVSMCVDGRDVLCPKLSYSARQQLVLASQTAGLPEPLEQPSAERVAELLMLFAAVGSAPSSGSTGSDPLPAVHLLDASAGEGVATAVFASAFAAVHAVESSAARFTALARNFGAVDDAHGGSGGGGGEGCLASIDGSTATGRVSLHRDLDAGIASATAARDSATATPGGSPAAMFGFFQFEEPAGPGGDSTADSTRWSLDRFRALLGAGCVVVAAMLPLSVDFETVAAALVAAPAPSGVVAAGDSEAAGSTNSTASDNDERPHPFKLEFSRPSYTAEGAPRSGLWQDWQLLVITAAPPQPQSSPPALLFGNARLDALVSVLLNFYNTYCKEHRPFFYDWEKQRTIQLSRWKGAKLAGEHDGLTLKELRATQTATAAAAAAAAGPEENSEDKEKGPDGATDTLMPAQEEDKEETSGGVCAVLSKPAARQCRLVWVLIVDGGTCDRKAGSAQKASWVGFDKGYRSRRDALARSVTAALWAEPASVADNKAIDQSQKEEGDEEEGPMRIVHGDCECHVIHEHTGELLSISPEFAKSWRHGGPPTEARLLKAFDDAARDAGSAGGAGSTDRYVPGLTVHKDTKTVAEATARILDVAGLHNTATAVQQDSNVNAAGRYAVIELHEDKDRFLPVYTAPSLEEQRQAAAAAGGAMRELDALVMVLGCVQDHSDAVATVVATSLKPPQPTQTTKADVGVDNGSVDVPILCLQPHLAVNVGPVSEFSSKVMHLLQAHHNARRLLPAVTMQLQHQWQREQEQAAPATETDVEATHSSPEPASEVQPSSLPPVADMLHFWVWCSGVRLAHLPTTEECKRAANPSLTLSHRPAVWRVPNTVLAAFAKSHGAYDNMRLSLVLDDAVVTVDGTVVTKHMTARGWGALTEHHALVALRDAIDADASSMQQQNGPRRGGSRGDAVPPVLAASFQQAIGQTLIADRAAAAATAAAVTVGDEYEYRARFVLLGEEGNGDTGVPPSALQLYRRPIDSDAPASVGKPERLERTHFLLVPTTQQQLRQGQGQGQSMDDVEREIRGAIAAHHSAGADGGHRFDEFLQVARCTYPNAESDGSGGVGIQCATAEATAEAEPVRTIVSLQGHHNCGVLARAVDEVMANE